MFHFTFNMDDYFDSVFFIILLILIVIITAITSQSAPSVASCGQSSG